MKSQIQVARRIGQKDYDGAIRILEGTLEKNKKDIPSLSMIALCHHWSGRSDMAIACTKQVLTFDTKNFDAIRLLSEIYAERAEHQMAAEHIRLGLENYPTPLPATPKIFFWLLRFVSYVYPKFKALEKEAREEIGNPNKSNEDWFDWAKQYLAWYDQTQGEKKSPTLH